MTNRISFSPGCPWLFSFVTTFCLALCLLPFLSGQATAQAVPAGMWPGEGGTNPTTQQPLAGQMLGTNLTLNQGVNSISAENESFQRFGLGLEAAGGVETNFLGTQTDQKTAGYAEFLAQGGVLLQNNRTRFFALYQPQYNLYPGYSDVNNFAQRLYMSMTHAFTEHTAVAWSMTAARYLSLNQYLPQSLGIGGVGVVVPTLGQQLLQDSFEVTNAATSLTLGHLISPRMTFTGTLTSGYFLILPADVASSGTLEHERFIASGADLRLDYQLTPRDTVGGEITPIYIYGFSPSGHEVAETAQVTYQRQLTSTLNVRAGAGPLFIQVSSPIFGSFQDTSYAVNASLSRQVRQSQFTVGYSRAIVVNLLSPAIVANNATFSAYLPLRRRWVVVGNASYAHDAGSGSYGTSYFYGGSGQIAYQVASKLQLFARYSLLSQHFNPEVSLQSYGFTRNQIVGGIRFNLGNPNTSGGVQ